MNTRFLIVTTTLLTMACGDAGESAPQRAETNGADAGDAAAQPDGDPSNADSNPADATSQQDTPEAGCMPSEALDAPDEEGVDANCDGADGTVGVDVYLHVNGGDDSSVGSPDAPVASLGRALELAAIRGGAVLIAEGEVSPEPLELDGNVALYGGYDTTFTGPPLRKRTVFHVDSEGWEISGNASISLHHLTVEGRDAHYDSEDTVAPSAYALRLDVDSALLDDVEIRAGDGAPGQAGEAGELGSEGIDASGKTGAAGLSCSGAQQPSYTNGANAGLPNTGGQQPGQLAAALPPPTGMDGFSGASGTNAQGLPMYSNGVLSFGQASSGADSGTAGYGGPGGGTSYGCVSQGGKHYRIQGGGGGTGGCPGFGGTPGTSGGGAVAVIVLRGSVDIQRSLLATGFAGTGGDGGLGGVGGNGGLGGVPSVVEFVTEACCQHPSYGCAQSEVDMPATCSSDPTGLNCAAYGASGGIGGPGGRGGGGAGGWAIGVMTLADGTVTLDTETEVNLGKAGTGGMGADNRAPDGERRTTHHIP